MWPSSGCLPSLGQQLVRAFGPTRATANGRCLGAGACRCALGRPDLPAPRARSVRRAGSRAGPHHRHYALGGVGLHSRHPDPAGFEIYVWLVEAAELGSPWAGEQKGRHRWEPHRHAWPLRDPDLLAADAADEGLAHRVAPGKPRGRLVRLAYRAHVAPLQLSLLAVRGSGSTAMAAVSDGASRMRCASSACRRTPVASSSSSSATTSKPQSQRSTFLLSAMSATLGIRS